MQSSKKVDRRGIDLVLREQLAGRRHSQIGSAFAGRSQVTLRNAGLGVDQIHVPRRIGRLEFLIRLHRFRKMDCNRSDRRVFHWPRIPLLAFRPPPLRRRFHANRSK